MKTRILIPLLLLGIATLACSLVGGSADTPAPPAVEVEVPAEALAPADEPVAEPAAEEPAEVAQEVSVVAPGPGEVDLSAAAVYAPPFANYTEQINVTYAGVDSTGAALTTVFEIVNQVQTDPVEASSMQMSTSEGDLTETFSIVVIDGVSYFYSADDGCFSFPADQMEAEDDPANFFETGDILTGPANLMESGVMMNGVLTDRYKLTPENLNPEDAANDEMELTSGSVYIAREGGYLVYMEIIGTAQDGTDLGNFAPDTPVDATMIYSLSPIEGELVIVPPAGCEGQADGGSEFPMMADAYEVFSMTGSVFYQTDAPIAEVIEFYKTEMAAAGWTLGEEVSLGSMATLTFTKDGRTVVVSPIESDGTTMVTISEE